MADDWKQLRDALPAAWSGAGLSIDAERRLVLGDAELARIATVGNQPRIPLLGSSLYLAFMERDGVWSSQLRGDLVDAIAADASPVNAESAFELALTADHLWPMGERLHVALVGGVTAVVALRAGVATLELRSTAAAEIEIQITPTARWTDAAGGDIEVDLPFSGFLRIALAVEAGGSLTLVRADAGAAARLVAGALSQAVATITSAFRDGVPSILGDVTGALGLPAPTMAGSVRISVIGERIAVEGISIKLGGIAFAGAMFLDASLRVPVGEPLGRFNVVDDAGLLTSASSPFTIVLRRGAEFELVVGLPGWRLSAVSANGAAVGAIVVPGISDADFGSIWPGGQGASLGGASDDRFVLDLTPANGAPALEIGTAGVTVTAIARARPMNLPGLTDVRVTDGMIQVRNGEWQLRVAADAGLPWFRGARGKVQVEGARSAGGYRFGATFQVTVTEGWTDPSGMVGVRNPSVTATLEWANERWKLGGFVGGTLVFDRAPFIGDAESWVGSIFSGLSAEFDRISLDSLKELLENLKGLELALRQPLRVSVWDIFNFEIGRVTIDPKGGIGFGGLIGFALGEVRFQGTLPDLRLSFRGGTIGLDLSTPTSFRGLLTAPSGVRAQMTFAREANERVEMLSGSGSLTGPAIPDVAVTVRVGRFRSGGTGSWRPTMMVFVSAPTNTPVLPGVVLKRIGVGFGIYQSLRGIGEVDSAASAFRLIRSGALPQPGLVESWEVDETTAISLVVQSLLGATTAANDVPDYYIADVVISLDSRLRLAGFGTVWLFTSPNDARTPEFQEHPYARGVLVLDANEPSIVAAYESDRDPRMSVARGLGPASAVLSGVLGAIQTRASLEARPGLFALTLGPNEMAFALGPFHASGQTLLAVRASKAGAHVIAAVSFSAAFEADASIGIGPATVGVSAAAGFSVRATLYGGIHKGRLLLAADLSASAYARLVVFVEIRFSIRIRAGFIKITIRFSKRWDFRFELQIDVGVTLALGTTNAAIDGHAAVRFSVVGISVRAKLPVRVGDASLLAEARSAMETAKSAALLPSST